MKIYIYFLRRKWWLLPLSAAVYLGLVFFQQHGSFDFYIDTSELYPCFLWGLITSYLLNNDTEIEFAKCYGMPLPKLGLAQYLPHFVYPLLTALLTFPLYRLLFGHSHAEAYLPHDADAYWRIATSLFITFFLATALGFFLRVAIRNTYGTLGVILIIFSPFFAMHTRIEMRSLPISYAKYDPWITAFLYDKKYDVAQSTWMVNRLVVLGLAILFLTLALLLLFRKKYENLK